VRRLATAAFICGAAAGSTVSVAACGSSGVGGDPVAEAATFTASSGTVHIALRAVVTPPGSPPVTLSGVGEEDLEAHAGKVDMTAPSVGQIRVIGLGRELYLNTPEVPKAIGKTWAKFDLYKAARAQGLDLSSLPTSSSNTADTLTALRSASGADTKRVGSELVRGVRTTHYRATIDLNRVPSRAGPSQRAVAQQAIRRIIQQTSTSKVPIDVWIDAAHRVRQVRYLQQTRRPDGQIVHMTMTVSMYGYGQPVSISAPRSGDVKDITAGIAGHG
jgi:hypothetical protein